MSGDYLRSPFWRHMEERLAEIRHRLAVQEACGGAIIGGVAGVPGFLEMEEELLDEAAELERFLLEQALQRESTY